ncbi:hypothetical protein [Mesorhizobium sp. BR1-1-2]|uniref:hypothetical protein n=1 Tax=Mesorhizobium sp. BR1-1-2 TaxID=2876652 RepID=UPI001CCB54E5|nr:hypothetical protein [Mesorhizobium sp. BR1-1-2]MBZ9963463.1 hypothetical protein [Mesorhizobium sp. BR1-1-2]
MLIIRAGFFADFPLVLDAVLPAVAAFEAGLTEGFADIFGAGLVEAFAAGFALAFGVALAAGFFAPFVAVFAMCSSLCLFKNQYGLRGVLSADNVARERSTSAWMASARCASAML